MLGKHYSLLLIDDDEFDHELAREALKQAGLPYTLHGLTNSEHALPFLRREGAYADAPPVQFVLMDLNMPRQDGFEVLRDIKADPELRLIPVVLFTASHAHMDVVTAYELGANSVIIKPDGFSALVETLSTLTRYWLQTVTLPQMLGE